MNNGYRMELRDIEYFLAIGTHRHVGRAAQEMGVSQPALSKSLRRLERELGTRLVERNSRGIAFTGVGAALLDRMHRIRLSVADVAREAADLIGGRAGHLRIGVSPNTSEYLPALYAVLAKEAPDLSLQVVDSDNDVMVPALCKGELDLVFNYMYPSPDERTTQERVFDEEWSVFASERHRLARRKHVSLADLAQERWALSTVQMISTNILQRAFRDKGLPAPRVAIEARPVRIRLQLLERSNLVTFTSRNIVDQAGTRLRIKRLPVRELTIARPVGVIYRKDAYLSPAARRFIEMLKKTVKEGAA
jgi:DNA-binding transcriptional LysR family regulator